MGRYKQLCFNFFFFYLFFTLFALMSPLYLSVIFTGFFFNSTCCAVHAEDLLLSPIGYIKQISLLIFELEEGDPQRQCVTEHIVEILCCSCG